MQNILLQNKSAANNSIPKVHLFLLGKLPRFLFTSQFRYPSERSWQVRTDKWTSSVQTTGDRAIRLEIKTIKTGFLQHPLCGRFYLVTASNHSQNTHFSLGYQSVSQPVLLRPYHPFAKPLRKQQEIYFLPYTWRLSRASGQQTSAVK